MYRLMGADGQPYGPASVEEIREWIREGKVSAQTQVQPDGATDWKPLGEFPDFIGDFPPPPLPPPPAPRRIGSLGASPEAEAYAQRVFERKPVIVAGDCIRRAWRLYLDQFGIIFGVNALVWVLYFLASGTMAGILITGPLLAGLYAFSLKKIRGQPTELADVFNPFSSDFLQTMLAGLVATLLIGFGFSLCIIPGIYLYVAWAFPLPLVLERRFQFWDALEVSRIVVTHDWWSYGTLVLLTTLINLGGILLCGVGLFLTLPLTTLAWMYAYEDTFGAVA